MFQRALRGLLDVLAPPTCAACRGSLSARVEGFCGACKPLLEPLESAAYAPHDHAAYHYGGPLRDALHRLKYAGASDVAPVLSRLLREPARALVRQVDLIAVVPLHPSRLRARGYNQSALLARPLRSLLMVPFAPALLRRTHDTDAQVGKTRAERMVQLSHSFVARPQARGRRVLVVDDVRTTGATLEEARRALRAAGAIDVFTLALALSDEQASHLAEPL